MLSVVSVGLLTLLTNPQVPSLTQLMKSLHAATHHMEMVAIILQVGVRGRGGRVR